MTSFCITLQLPAEYERKDRISIMGGNIFREDRGDTQSGGGFSDGARGCRNFKTVVYFVAHATANVTRDELERQLAFFERYMKLDKVYLEVYRNGELASQEQVDMCRKVFEAHGVEVAGGLTTTFRHREGMEPKARLFATLCYNDPVMTGELEKVCAFLGKNFDEFIIDDFFFTNCTCDACRAGKERYNKAHDITDGSWQAYRLDLMHRVSEQYVIAPARKENPGISITIKYPNWAESYQETGYNPAQQREIFDNIYTGTETRDPNRTSQHLPRYLSYSLMTYMENMRPGHNGGGWFDPFDMHITEHYLEQAYLTAFAKPREMMMFCFQALYDTMNVPALGFHLERLDDIAGRAGSPVGIMCYLPDNCQGEDIIQDYLGMCGLPIVCTPYFPESADVIMLTRSSAYDPDIVSKLEAYLCRGGRAIVTAGFAEATQERGIKALTSIRFAGRRVRTSDFYVESGSAYDWPNSASMVRGCEDIEITVPEFRNNSTWAIIKAADAQENFGMMLLDKYGKGEMITLSLPDSFSSMYRLPEKLLSRIRKQCAYNGIWFEGSAMTSIFLYDNDTFVLYRYVDSGVFTEDIRLHISGAKSLTLGGKSIQPLYTTDSGEAVFDIRIMPGQYILGEIMR